MTSMLLSGWRGAQVQSGAAAGRGRGASVGRNGVRGREPHVRCHARARR